MLQDIKKEFFALRNGIVADTLRKAGMHYKVIFGLQIPQIATIARNLKESYSNADSEYDANEKLLQLADLLWADHEVRESRILACYLFPHKNVNKEKALKLASEIKTPEEGDMLAFRLLKRLDFAQELLQAMERYPHIPASAILSLKRHLE